MDDTLKEGSQNFNHGGMVEYNQSGDGGIHHGVRVKEVWFHSS